MVYFIFEFIVILLNVWIGGQNFFITSVLSNSLFHLDQLLVGQDAKADALDEVIIQAHLDLHEFFHAFDKFDFVWMLAFASALNHQLLRLGDEFEADQAPLPVRCLDHFERWSQCTIVGESAASKLGRHGSISHGEAERFDVGANTPL